VGLPRHPETAPAVAWLAGLSDLLPVAVVRSGALPGRRGLVRRATRREPRRPALSTQLAVVERDDTLVLRRLASSNALQLTIGGF
jgi:hypothetical protein